jgi:ATP-dependent DNA helicase PIF1
MVEAGETANGAQLRSLFASILCYNEVADPLALYIAHKAKLCEGVEVDQRRWLQVGGEVPAEFEHQALRLLSKLLHSMGGRTLRQFNPPVPPPERSQAEQGLVAAERARYTAAEQAELARQAEAQLNAGQRQVYDAVLAAVASVDSNMGVVAGQQHVFFIDGLGGAGKTFVYKALLANVRGQEVHTPMGVRGKIALSVASSGIAALLLPGGQTAHRQFKLPLKDVTASSSCGITRTCPLADLIRQTSLIVWDEAPMMHKHLFEALDRTLKDIMQPGVHPDSPEALPFGGKVVVMGGDFRQVLPVVPRASNQQVVAACLNKSDKLWPHVQVFRLHENMRVAMLSRDPSMAGQAAAQAQFADFVKAVGDGTVPTHPDVFENAICIPPHICCSAGRDATLQDLITDVYGGYLGCRADMTARSEFLVERAILTPLNEDVDLINQQVAEYFDTVQLQNGGDALAAAVRGPNAAAVGPLKRTYLSSDSVKQQEQVDMYPAELLNGLNISGMPPHQLHLRVGAPIILLRNLHGGLANGTRLIVTKLLDHVLVARVATGRVGYIGSDVYLPRLTIEPTDVERMPFTLQRRQFPVRPAFAMTINKAQGQTLRMVGIYLPKPVFGHGQLYVALSRVGSASGVRVLVPDGWRDATEHGGGPGMYTANVVFRDVLLPDTAA